MMNTTNNLEQENNIDQASTYVEPKPDDIVEFEPEGDSIIEKLLRTVIEGYKTNFNKTNEKVEIDFIINISTHKIATKEGNKDVAYLRLDRSVREKNKLIPQDGIITDADGWETKLLHQEVYFFRNLQERLKPNAPWKENLYLNCLARLTSAGLEYAELLQRLKNTKQTGELDTEERAAKSDIQITTEMPKALTPDEQKYAEWVKNEKAKEGL